MELLFWEEDLFFCGGGQRSCEVNRGQKPKPYKNDISRYESCMLFILAMWVRYSQKMNSIGFGRCQKLSEVIEGENRKFLIPAYRDDISRTKWWKFSIIIGI